MNTAIDLNGRASRIADELAAHAAEHRVQVSAVAGARVIDCGIQAPGGISAGIQLARTCLAGLADVSLVPGEVAGLPFPHVQVASDNPVLACMASQYAGWQISVEVAGGKKFFAMGSGPMRAAYGKEELFEKIGGKERPTLAVGVLETRKLPPAEVVQYLADRLQLAPEAITLLVAPAASPAGTLQVVARSLETALHKLYELKFDLSKVVSGYGLAPLPPVAADELQAVGRTNDAILYGGRVVLWVRAADDELAALGPKVPSSGSPDHGAPFAEVFERFQRDFYKIDPMLFSPAVIVIHNLNSGRCHTFGKLEPDVLRRSFLDPA